MNNSFEPPSDIRNKYRKYLSVAGILFLVGLLIHLSTREQKKEERVIYVEVTKPVRKTMENSIATTGTIKAQQRTTLSSKIPGKIQSIDVKTGDMVEKNEVLIRLESKELELQTEIAESAHRSAASSIDEENYKRHKILYEEGVITKAEFDKIESEYKAAKAEKDRQEKTVELQKEQVSSTAISSPFNAMAAKILVNSGEVIAAGQPLAILVNMDFVDVEVPIASKNIEQIKKGQEAQITVDSSPKLFSGAVDRIEQVADPISRTFNGLIKVKNPNHILKHGMFAKVSIFVDRRPQAVTIPKTALVKKEDLQQGRWIYLIENNRAHLQQIETGLDSAEDIEVTSPLDLQATVVVSGQSQLHEGASVSILNPHP